MQRIATRRGVISAEFGDSAAILVAQMELSARDRAILDFERAWWCMPPPKARQIRARLDLSSSRYYSRLAELTDLPAALEYDPLTVRRLRRDRDLRRRARYEGRRADPGSR